MKKSLPQYAKVEQTFGAEPPILHCPICGKAMIENFNEGFDPCSHVSFVVQPKENAE